jgi:hypothetical protein
LHRILVRHGRGASAGFESQRDERVSGLAHAGAKPSDSPFQAIAQRAWIASTTIPKLLIRQ